MSITFVGYILSICWVYIEHYRWALQDFCLEEKQDKISAEFIFERGLLLRGSCHGVSVTEGVRFYQASFEHKLNKEHIANRAACD